MRGTQGAKRRRPAPPDPPDRRLMGGADPTSEIDAAIATHAGESNPHPVYLTAAEGGAAYAALSHAHAEADVTGLTAALAAKAPLVSPSFTTPTLGVATATTINKVALTQPAAGSTLQIDDGFTLRCTGNVTALAGAHTGASSGTNTGDQTSVSGNAGTASVAATVTIADAAGDTTMFLLLAGSSTGNLPVLTDAGLTYNATTDALTVTTVVANLTGNVTGNVTGALTGTASGNLVAISGARRFLQVQDVAQGTTSFVPHASATFWIIEGVGAGGGGGGCTDAATNGIGAGGGGGGAWARVSSSSVANPTACVVGAGGLAGTAGNNGGAGNDTTFGAILVAKAGLGGIGGTVGAAAQNIKIGGDGGAAGSCTGDEKTSGQPGGIGFALVAALAASGPGGSSMWGGGGNSRAGQGNGIAGVGWGGGGSGGCIVSSGGDQTGGAGANGRLRVWEFASA